MVREIDGPGWALTLEDDGDDAYPALKRELGVDSPFRLGIVEANRNGYRIELVGARWYPHWPRESARFMLCEQQHPNEMIMLSLVRGRAFYGDGSCFVQALWDRNQERISIGDIPPSTTFEALRPVYAGLAWLFRMTKKTGPRSLPTDADADWMRRTRKAEELYADAPRRGFRMSWADAAAAVDTNQSTLKNWRRRLRQLQA